MGQIEPDDNSTPAPAGDEPAGNDITALRAAMFATLGAVRAGTLDTDRARAINALAATLIDSARVEIEHMKLIDATEASAFLGGDQAVHKPRAPQNGITGVVRHRLGR